MDDLHTSDDLDLEDGANTQARSDAPSDLSDPDLYINRELSQLQFINRVHAMARDETLPLLERLRFLCISSTVLDEFFEVRVASVRQQRKFSADTVAADGLTLSEQLVRIREQASDLIAEQYRSLNEFLLPALEKENIRLRVVDELSDDQKNWLKRHFKREIMPVLSPLGLDPAHPFPRILNKSLNFIVELEGIDAFGRTGGMAVVRAPRSLPRVVRVPGAEDSASGYDFVLLSSILATFMDQLFPGMSVKGAYAFRVTRNSELFVDEEEIDNLARALQGQLLRRGFAEALRLEISSNSPNRIIKYLTQHFDLSLEDVYQCEGPVNLNRLSAIVDAADRPDLKFVPFVPRTSRELDGDADPFEVLRHRDVLLHLPFESFSVVVDLLAHAARDPNVLAIKQTLYRTGIDSIIVRLLLDAARAGKEVTAVIEVRARFDEEANIELANRLQEAGVQVVYGIVGYKTHAKMLMIVRREQNRVRRYVHLGTGNYHVHTARLYTDFGLLTADKTVAGDVHNMFQLLTGLGTSADLKRLYNSPFTLHNHLIHCIDREIKHVQAGDKGLIQAKMNALTEPSMIRALYRASQAGVKIQLIIRGQCCLRPGIKGISENITVRSVIGRLLEHTRSFRFENNGEPEVLLASADWMDRNLFHRVETCFEIRDEDLARRVTEEDLELYLSDNTQAWELKPDGEYQRLTPAEGAPAINAQSSLLNRFCGIGEPH